RKEKAITPCLDDSAVCAARQLCKDFIEETGTNGIQVAIGDGNKLLWSESFGFADFENRIRVTDSTLFRINSVSKALTSMALAKLHSEGKLNLDAPVQQYVPGFPVKKY